MSARERLFANLGRALEGAPGRVSPEEAAARLDRRTPNLIPDRAQGSAEDLVARFIHWAERVQATTARVATLADVPAAAADFLNRQNLPQRLRLAPHPLVEGLDWASRPLMEVAAGRAEAHDLSSLALAFAGVAETGTLMLHSGPQTPTTLNFLPDNHIVLLPASAIIGSYEAAWARLREAFGADWPRTVNLVTGPSRTADIEQELILGAHGPRRLHIIIVDDDARQTS